MCKRKLEASIGDLSLADGANALSEDTHTHSSGKDTRPHTAVPNTQTNPMFEVPLRLHGSVRGRKVLPNHQIMRMCRPSTDRARLVMIREIQNMPLKHIKYP